MALQSEDLSRVTSVSLQRLVSLLKSVGLPHAKKSSVLCLGSISADISPLQSLDVKLSIHEVQQGKGVENKVRRWKIEGKDRRNHIHWWGDVELLLFTCLLVTGECRSSEHSSCLLFNKHICMYICFTLGKIMELLVKAFKLSGEICPS